MVTNPFVGNWAYRSFHNLPRPVDSFDELRFGQAELTLEDAGSDLVSGRFTIGNDALIVVGAVQGTTPPTIRFRATGIDGTGTAGWIYDYTGHLARAWHEADTQRPAIVGTVMRVAPHAPQADAGYAASFVAVSRDRPADPYRLPETVTAHFADRMHRLHHLVWHSLRNNWNNPRVVTPVRRARIEGIGWGVIRPAREFDGPAPKRPAITNGSGEDFLYFHREMLRTYHALMNAAGESPIRWVDIPPPGDTTNEVPAAWAIGRDLPSDHVFERRVAALKTDEFHWSRMRWWDQQFKDPTYLATLTLGELGALLEFSVHNDMHIRWTALPRDPETNVPLPTGRAAFDIAPKWDHPRYDPLLDFYSSHVHSVFWRLHGWIDDRLDDWFAAHERLHPGEVVRQPHGAVEWFKPGRWVQVTEPWVWPEALTNGHHGDADLRQRRIASMEELVAILTVEEAISDELAVAEATGALVSLDLLLKAPV